MRVLVVEDDPQSRDYIATAMNEDGHAVQTVGDGQVGLAAAVNGEFDVLIIDRMLPSLDGLTLVRTLRREGVQTPALFLTALGAVDDRVAGLTGGGDDYLVKPFSFEELSARINLLGRRRTSSESAGILSSHGLRLDRLSRSATLDGAPIDLKPLKFKILEHFMLHAGHVWTRAMLLERIWGFKFDPRTNIVESHLSRLRAKIDRPGQAPLIATIRGAGYIFRVD